jgi:threonine synthase
MEYISTRNTQEIFSFKSVFLNGLASDGGLYIPKQIPLYSNKDLKKLRNFSYKELAAKIISDFCTGEFNEFEIKTIVEKSYKDFRVKDVVTVNKFGKINLLELFHGPTLAFKDIAMQAIGNMYENILEKSKLKVNVVVATSGDTGAAAISAIKNRKNMKIFVLHPENKISDVQRKFMTTVEARNVFNIGLAGNFDDCQNIVKSMFADNDFRNLINISGVNSINWARIIFQIVYYFFCYFKITKSNERINFSVPTGNFGDIYAGYVAKKMGLPINKLIIATNKNDILKRVMETGCYKPSEVKHTISPSMDIQVASNFERLIFNITACDSNKTLKLMNDLNESGEFQLAKEELQKIRNSFLSESLSDEVTKSVISEMYKNYGVLVDPHTAVGIGVTKKISPEENTVVLSTAHPSKFPDVVMKATGIKPELPENLKSILVKKEKYDRLPKDFEKVKKYIRERK